MCADLAGRRFVAHFPPRPNDLGWYVTPFQGLLGRAKYLKPISNFNLKYEYPNFLFIQPAHQFNTFLPTKNLHFNSLIFNR